MEVKVDCTCGTRYKFDVEPVNHRMPYPVACPACGADGTALANDVIAQTPVANPPVAVALPVAPPPPPVAPVGGLKINRQAHFEEQPAPAGPPPAVLVQPYRPPAGEPAAGWKKALVVVLVCVVVAGISYKVVKRVIKAADFVSVIAGAVHAANEMEKVQELNLTADDAVILYLKHTNHTEVAQECVAYWKEKLNRNLRILSGAGETGEGTEYVVMPSHNGYVRVMGNLDWKEPQFEAAAKHLSEKFHTMVFEEKDVDFTGEFVFGVYDNGVNVFHARMDVKIAADDVEETVKTEHNEWALANGYKPGPNGFKDFNIMDGNDLTKKFGMKFWDEPDETTNHIVLKDPAARVQ